MTRSEFAFSGAAAIILFAAGALYGSIGMQAETRSATQPVEKVPGTLRFPAGAPQLAMIQVAPAPVMPVPLAEPLHGRVSYDESHTARVSAPIAGRVVDLRAQIGDEVRAGAPLAVIDAPELGTAEADVVKARADEQRKLLALQRARELFAAEVLARKDLESVEADHRQAQAESRRAALRLANLNPRRAALAGERMTLSSPLAGVVAERKANPGMEVRPDLAEPLFVITDLRFAQVVVDLPEPLLAKIRIGLPVTVEVDAYPGTRFSGRIERIAPTVDPATRRVQVRCSVENLDGKLKPEMYARVALLTDRNRTAVRLPNSALVTEGLYSFAFVEREPGVFVKRKVELGVQDRDFSYVGSGLHANEPVVVRGALLLNSELASGG